MITVNILFGLGRLVLGFVVMLLAFNVFSLPTNSSSFVIQKAAFFKFVATILIVSGSYSVVHEIFNSEKTEVEWNDKDKTAMIKSCLRDSGPTAKKYPKLATEYCICTTENIVKNIKKDTYLLLLKKSLKDQLEAQYQYIENCLDELNLEIKQLEARENL